MADCVRGKDDVVGSNPAARAISFSTIKRGDISKWRVALALLERGEVVLHPVSEDSRYDLAIDRDGVLYRIQCKTGKYKRGCVVFKAASVHGHRGKPPRNYVGQIDAFGVYCPQLGKTYLVPIDSMRGRAEQSLRIDPCRNGQKRGFVAAVDFEI